jgi:NAD-dependent deacetylase
LTALERTGRLAAIVTQNIDGLHQKAGSNPASVIELHGTTHVVRCLRCGAEAPAAEVQSELAASAGEPRCRRCGGPQRAATILFGEALPAAALQQAVAAARQSDLMLVVGTSLVVNPAARLPSLAKQAGAKLAIVNRTETPLDDAADLLVRGDAGPALAAAVASLPEIAAER